jgi:hypothetical protein
MRNQPVYHVRCPFCRANVGSACKGVRGETLRSVHFQRSTALRSASIAALKYLYAPLPRNTASATFVAAALSRPGV